MTIRTPELDPDEQDSLDLDDPAPPALPKAIYYIVGNEFCERFSFYGMKAILPIYLTARLSLDEDRATTIIHAFNFAAYLFTLLGAFLADSGGWGKYQTILRLSLVYVVGSSVLAVTSAMSTPLAKIGMEVGLFLVAMGTGGIKPCVSSFGGDQFEDAVQIAKFFSLFYFAINAGSVLSMLITPILRQDLHW